MFKYAEDKAGRGRSDQRRSLQVGMGKRLSLRLPFGLDLGSSSVRACHGAFSNSMQPTAGHESRQL